MVECKYYSFYALAKINDPELLYEVTWSSFLIHPS